MAWRLAKSLEKLRSEINTKHKGTTFWTIGDSAHRGTWSDHNPNAAGVVCAADVLGDKGLNLTKFAETIRTSGHPAFKYVIFNRRIAFRGGSWQPYYGDNPHTTHVHISVGNGPDGRSTGPYDNQSSWKLWSDDVSAKDVWRDYFIDKIDKGSGSSPRMRPESYLAWNHEYAKQNLAQGREMLANQTAMLEVIKALSIGQGLDPEAITEAAFNGAKRALEAVKFTVVE